MGSGKFASTVILGLSLLLLQGTATAAFTITGVANAASRIPSGSPGYGIAQGGIFVVTGQGVGPEQPQQASFPLPTAAGLGGVSIRVNVGDTAVDAIMVYVSPNEVGAILPSSTPKGDGTVTVSNGDSTATAPVTVVASAFGIFTTANGYGAALAFNAAGDGSQTANGVTQAVQPGQNLTLLGTGLGAIASDETQAGATDTPSAKLTVWVGTSQATIVSAGRGSCCAGLDPGFPIPQGAAGLDVVVITIPDGVAGCQVAVAVQAGDLVSNIGGISVAPGGGLCVDISGIDLGNLITLSGKVKFGFILLNRTVTKIAQASLVLNSITDVGAATFTQVDLGDNTAQVPTQVFTTAFGGTAGSCFVTNVRSTGSTPGNSGNPGRTGPPTVLLDAGPAINIAGPNGTKPMPRNKEGAYGAALAAYSVSQITVPGVPPINTTTGGPPFLEPGTITADNGGGGADIGHFNVDLTNAKPITWDNFDQLNAVTRAQGATVKWSGGDPNSWVGISGTAVRTQGGVTLSGSFTCVEKVSAGQFTVPAYVTANMPAVDAANPASGIGLMVVSNTMAKIVSIPGVDLTNYYSTVSSSKTLSYR
jgi:uncharacterized protein (TIGR03437 family)